MTKQPKPKLSPCGVRTKKAHDSWGDFEICPKCGETLDYCIKTALKARKPCKD